MDQTAATHVDSEHDSGEEPLPPLTPLEYAKYNNVRDPSSWKHRLTMMVVQSTAGRENAIFP